MAMKLYNDQNPVLLTMFVLSLHFRAAIGKRRLTQRDGTHQRIATFPYLYRALS